VSAPRAAAAILAGGRARRFGGRDKSRLVIEGRTIILRQLDVLTRVVDDVFVVASDAERFADLGLAVHADRIPNLGAIGGLHTAIAVSPAERVLVVACDLPFLEPTLLARLVELSADGDGAWVRSTRGIEPLVACYTRRAARPIRAAIDARRLKLGDLAGVLEMAEIAGPELAAFGSPDRLLANVNTPDEYAQVQYGAS
jgi:molybdopterin-guanine dinucleotide biosynthesis protein A